MLVADTGVRHDLAAGEYANRRAGCERVAEALGVRSLRDATISMLNAAKTRRDIDDPEHRRAMHVVLENVRTLLAAHALRENRIEEFCAQMFESHRSLRCLYEVSSPELDLIVDAAAELKERTGDDRLGARMTGGGFGGCAIILCRTPAANLIETIIRARFADVFGRQPALFQTGASHGVMRAA
jgi:galactokinase